MPQDGNALAGRIAFTYPDFVLYTVARAFIVTATEMQSVAVGWQVYEITHRPLDLGLVGLAQFLPGFFLFLVSGHVADRFDRKRLLGICYAGFALCSGLLLMLALRHVRTVLPIYGVLLLLGAVRSLNGPVSRALLPQLVSTEHFPNAVAWNSTNFQAATILGPSIGGLMYAAFHGPAAVYGTSCAIALGAMAATQRIRSRTAARPAEPMSASSVFAGFRYIWRQRLILGLISLDMFAVLLGGAVALLPVYASEILKTGPWGLGLLRSAPGIGAAAMAVYLAHRPLKGKAGIAMLWAVGGFGIFTILFGVSRSLPLSLGFLILVGASDMISVIIRGTLIQLATPDAMRGRVNAVDMLFIGVSNEFGQFESGLTAHWFGTVPSVVLGGIGTLVVIAAWAWIFPELRQADRLHAIAAESLEHSLDASEAG
jgi:MFS family permease